MYDHRRHHQVIALVRVFGTTIENEDVASSELSFPITYCEGCLVHYPLAAINPQTDKIPSDSPRPARIHGHQRRERSAESESLYEIRCTVTVHPRPDTMPRREPSEYSRSDEAGGTTRQ
jgi:hypothetical protein